MTPHDRQTRFHEEWLGLVQPVEGLVFSLPVLVDAQIAPEVGPELTARFRELLTHDPDTRTVSTDLRRLFADFLGYDRDGMLVARDRLPDALRFYAEEGRQELRPSYAIGRGPFTAATDDLFAGFGTDPDAPATPTPDGAAPYIALVWDLRDDGAPVGLSLDKPEDTTGPWRYPPTAKFERLLRHTGVPLGLLFNGRELRLVYAPTAESTSHLTFRFSDMSEAAGRPILAAFQLLLSARRTYESAPEHTLEGLLRESRRRQADVTRELAEQVFEAVELLLEGFEQAALRDIGSDWLRAALEHPHDHLYRGVLSVVLRLVFILYAEDQGLFPIGHRVYAAHMSVQGLYEDLVADAGMHPESMHHRFGAYGRMLALFRAVFLGVRHGDLVLPPRQGRLFDPSSFPFLEGGLPGSTAAITQPEARADIRPPPVDDGVIYAVLRRLILFKGQRLSYRALDVEQIGSVYESLMGYHVVRVASPAVRLGKTAVWVETAALRKHKPADRARWLDETCDLTTAQRSKLEAALAEHNDHAALAEALLDLAPGGKRERERHRASAGRLVLQPGDERRHSGSHYTPRSLTERIVRRTLEPILACLGDAPTAEQILALKVCDPAMGSGAFLVEVCRHLADQLVAAWTRAGTVAALTETYGNPHLHARRLVAQRCLYGVDKNDAAVELAKLSLWLVTMSRELPFTFVDHALRHGDSLVGFDLDQIAAFHWQPGKQRGFFSAIVKDALEQAIAHRKEIHDRAEREDNANQQEKRRLLDHADHATERVRLIADLCVGAFFKESTDKAREGERQHRQHLVERWLAGEETLDPDIRSLAAEIREQHAPFHWWLEFPEVFYEERPDPLDGGKVNGAAYMEAFVGNPPFMGQSRISGGLGEAYRDWLFMVHLGSGGMADLSAHFFRRAKTLLGTHGALGFVATNTIAQGDTRESGLGRLVSDGWSIFDATRSLVWPGGAAVTVSVVHVTSPSLRLRVTPELDGERVSVINSRLLPRVERQPAAKLSMNEGLSYIGCKVGGQGFVLSPDEARELANNDPRNAQCIRPYIGGEEVNSHPQQMHSRHVIDFATRPLDEAQTWPALISIVRETVKPYREGVQRESWKKRWWQFAEVYPAMRAAVAPLKRCLVTSLHSKHLLFSFQPTERIFSHALAVFAFDASSAFAVLQSRVHEPWARMLSSSMKTDLRYTASDCFDTFPFPHTNPREVIPAVEAAGEAFYEARARFMLETDQGLTKTYNALKDPENTDPRVLELRRQTEAMDRAVLDAYGWTDLPVPPYCPRTDAKREAVQAFEDEVIDRLYVLNAERAAEEERLGLRKDKKGKQVRKPSAKPAADAAVTPNAVEPSGMKAATKKTASKRPAAKKAAKKTGAKKTAKNPDEQADLWTEGDE
jgi:hypothetical protein